MTDLRAFAPDEIPLATAALDLAFLDESTEEHWAIETAMLDVSKTLGAVQDGRAVVTGAWFDHTMTVPGATAPVAGVTWVSVAPTHRRRGLLRQLMQQQLTDLHEQGRLLAALWASESAIYQRFGYGPASWQHTLEIPRGAAFLREVDVRGLRLETPTQQLLAPIFNDALPAHPGWFARDEAWWSYRLYDPPAHRNGAAPLRCVVDGADGYALYSPKQGWSDGKLASSIHVRELVAVDPQSEARLWRFLLDIDLVATVNARLVSTDCPLHQLIADPRTVSTSLTDGLWFRLVDVAGLALRRYATDVDVVLDVTDAFCPWNAGTWRLSAGLSGAACSRTSDAPDLRLDVRDLGAAFLGGTSLTSRAAAGWVEELTPGALQRASVAFGPLGRTAHANLIF